jgi:cytochrome b subunit of formate dehydrogenase
MAESDDAQVQRTSPLGLVRNHVTLVLTLIPILLSGLRIFAVANGDRPTLVTLLSTLDVKAVLLGTFAWLLPTVFGVAAAICWIRWLQRRSAAGPLSGRQSTALLWLAVCTRLWR